MMSEIDALIPHAASRSSNLIQLIFWHALHLMMGGGSLRTQFNRCSSHRVNYHNLSLSVVKRGMPLSFGWAWRGDSLAHNLVPSHQKKTNELFDPNTVWRTDIPTPRAGSKRHVEMIGIHLVSHSNPCFLTRSRKGKCDKLSFFFQKM